MQSIAQSIETIGILTGRISRSEKEEIRHFTDADYQKMAQKIFDERDMYEESERYSIYDILPNVDIIIDRTVKGGETTGGSYDYGAPEGLWAITREEFHIAEFECFDREMDDAPNDFSIAKLEAILNK